MASGTQRLFIAADPPADLAEQLSAWARAQRSGSRGLRIVEPANIHLTLAFLGERPVAEIPEIAGAVADAVREGAGGAIEGLAIGEPVLLPPRRPRVLAVGVTDPEQRLSDLRSAVAAELTRAIGWSDDRRFRPHLTLARVARDGRVARELSAPPHGEFDVPELVLYRSHLDPAGARYEAVERIALI